MLRELNIKNLAIIDDLTVRFAHGLNVLSGETGAGKSIIVEALGLALGDRAQGDMIRTGEKEAVVQAYFEIPEADRLPETGIDMSDGVVLRRVISQSGKSRAYLNDVMVTLQTLSDVGKSLVDIHSQHEHQSLMMPEKQRMIIDAYGGHDHELEQVRNLFKSVQSLGKEVNDLTSRIRDRAHRGDLLRFQISEIDSAALKPSEKEALEEERKILLNLSRLKDAAETAYALLYEDGSCIETLGKVISRLREMDAIDHSVSDTLSLAESAMPLLKDAALGLRSYREKYNLDPLKLEELQGRLELLKRLEKKYGASVEDILALRKSAAKELQELEISDGRIESLQEEYRKQLNDLRNAAEALSEKRERTAKKTETLIMKNLRELAFTNARFSINVIREKDEAGDYIINTSGMDRIEFLFSGNAGEPMKTLAKIVSGGELSRIMLSLKSILAEVDSIPVLIFDEVDAGIGGKTAEVVGAKLRKISESHQLLCITHLPQIASLAVHHLRIEKVQKNGRVRVVMHELHGAERQDEIARMLSGTVTEISRRHAEELLERTR